MNTARNQKKQKRKNPKLSFSSGLKKNYWFLEKTLPGAKSDSQLLIKVKKKVAAFKTPFQKGEVLDTLEYGRILVLDGILQLSEKDEFIYHEMMAHLALFSHPNPEKILIIGGGDGGVLREVLKHPVKKVFLAEIDKKIIEISQKYLSFVSKNAFKNKKVKIFFKDGQRFIKNYEDFFDVIIVDSTDPKDFSLPLFSKKFYQDVFKALTKKGIMISQSGAFWGPFFYVKKIFKNLKKIFPFVKIHRAAIPAYGEVEYSLTLGSKLNLNKIDFSEIKKRYKKLNLKTKYYSPEIHLASGILPKIYQIE